MALTYWFGRLIVVVFGYLCFLMLCIWFLNFHFINDGVITGTLRVNLPISQSMENAILMALYYLAPIGVFVLFATYIYAGVTIALLIVSLFALRAFGWLSLIEAAFLDASVEPLPFGAAVLEHISWKESASNASEALTHSWTYSHPEALKRLEEWCCVSLQRGCRETPAGSSCPTWLRER